MKTVTVRDVTFGEGLPKICVPIVGNTQEAVLDEAERIALIQGRGADLCEWRIDWFDGVFDVSSLTDTAKKLRAVLGTMPLLVTFRTKGEGGQKECDIKNYAELLTGICQSDIADMIDIELFSGDELVTEMITMARSRGIKTIISNHDFHATPTKDEIVARLSKMEELGADICKIAVMPVGREDVLTLMEATLERSRKSNTPLITMSMGTMGCISRLCGELTGSCLTFGSMSKASAPGQIQAEKLSYILGLLSI